MSKQTWQNIYTAGQQLNKYPYDFIVSSFFRIRANYSSNNKMKVLDLGCGAGNHALFCAENGADVVAVDYSKAVLAVVNERARDRGLQESVRTQQVDFEEFSLEETNFDMVIDRLSVSHVARQYALSVYDTVYEVLNNNGVVLSNVFTTGHSHKKFGEYDAENDVWHNFTDGIFQQLKTACFYTEEDIKYLFRKFTLQSLLCETEKNMLENMRNETEQLEIWKVIARKQL